MIKKTILPSETSTKELHQYIIGSVAPRPIAFVSTVDENGVENLAPYSFFNAFSSNPPVLVFSSNRKVSDNSTKDTLHNVRATGEAVVNMVSYPIVRQMSLASVEFPSDISEFSKTGLTAIPSERVKAPSVLESPVNMECKIKDIVTLGEHGGAGHLIICEVVLIKISEDVFTDGKIDPHKMDLMGRLGRNFYVRASGAALMEIYQSVTEIPIGWDGLPQHIRESKILTGNEIATLASLKKLPEQQETDQYLSSHEDLKALLAQGNPENIHLQASQLIQSGHSFEALCLLMA